MFQAVAPLLLLVASTAEPEKAAAEPPRVRLELAAGGLWQREYDDDYGQLETSGPGLEARATFRLGRHAAFATDLAWIRGEDPWPDYSNKSTRVTLTGSLQWHFGKKSVQPYLGLGAALSRREYCFDRASDRFPSQCSTNSETSPIVLQAGVKFIRFPSGLIIAPEVRIEYLILRFGLSVGWARLR